MQIGNKIYIIKQEAYFKQLQNCVCEPLYKYEFNISEIKEYKAPKLILLPIIGSWTELDCYNDIYDLENAFLTILFGWTTVYVTINEQLAIKKYKKLLDET